MIRMYSGTPAMIMVSAPNIPKAASRPGSTGRRAARDGQPDILIERDGIDPFNRELDPIGGFRQPDWHHDRVVRLLSLRHGRRARVQSTVFSDVRPARRHAGGVRDLRGRLRRTSDW